MPDSLITWLSGSPRRRTLVIAGGYVALAVAVVAVYVAVIFGGQ